MLDKTNFSVNIKVPAKIMLSGEYAVMSGFSSLSLALNKYLTVTLKKSSDHVSRVRSSLWETPFCFEDISELKNKDDILLATIVSALEEKKIFPFDFFVSSDFSVSSGFGSSSALRLAVHYAFCLYSKALEKESLEISSRDSWLLAKKAFADQLTHQTKASGYDVVTQKLGGSVLFKPKKSQWPQEFENFDFDEALLRNCLHVYTGGKGALTKKVMKKTDDWLEENKLKKDFFSLSEKLTKSFKSFFLNEQESSKEKLISSIKNHRTFMKESPFYLSSLENSLSLLEGFDKTWTYKTTGSGGEDALLFFGEEEHLREAKEILSSLGWCEDLWRLDSKGITYFLSSEGVKTFGS